MCGLNNILQCVNESLMVNVDSCLTCDMKSPSLSLLVVTVKKGRETFSAIEISSDRQTEAEETHTDIYTYRHVYKQ